jgi:hypothetical protein
MQDRMQVSSAVGLGTKRVPAFWRGHEGGDDRRPHRPQLVYSFRDAP